jgi:hypothetical protein
MASIAQYLLHLAENPHAATLHNRSKKSADDYMRAFGLNDRQRKVIATRDQKKINAAIARELAKSAGPGKRMWLTTGSTITPGGGGGGGGAGGKRGPQG